MTNAITRMAKRLWKVITRDWRYQGITNPYMGKHSWTNGAETVDVYWMNGAADYDGFVVEVTGRDDDAILQLSNGFVDRFRDALVLADMYIRDDCTNPTAFMPSDKVKSDHGPGNAVRQDEWLDAHAHEYEFHVIKPSEVEDSRHTTTY